MKRTLYTLRILSLQLILLLFVTSSLIAQQTNNWYFGSAGCQPNTGMRIDFSSGSPVVSTGYPQLTEEGSSSISDAAGNPLFYTDGTNIWNASTNVQFNSFALGGGSSSSQSAIILPKPSVANEWLVFTVNTNGNTGAYYVTVRQTGAVFSILEAAPVPLVGAGIIGEGLCIMGSTKLNSAYWVIMRDRSTTGGVRAFEVTNTGVVITTPVTSTLSGAGFTNTNYNQYIGIIKSNTCQTKLAFTYFNGDADITNFDAATGQVTAGTAVKISTSLGTSYGLEFSPNDQFLYITALTAGTVYRYNIGTNTNTLIHTMSSGEAGQLQLAPDGLIYMARMTGNCPAVSYLARINNPDNTPAATVTENAVLLSGVTNSSSYNGGSYRGLPTFTKSLVSTSLSAFPGDNAFCVNTDIPLSYLFGGSVASRTWAITPGTLGVNWSYTTGTSTSAAPTIRFLTTGTYTVTPTITDNCTRVYSDPMTITISNPKVPAGSINCGTNSITLNATGSIPGDYANYVWYSAASGGNVLGVGTPVTLGYSAIAQAPTSVWVEVASSVITTSTGTNQTIGPASGTLTWGGRGTGNYSTTFTAIANVLTLNSFVVTPQGTGGLPFTVEIQNAATAVVFTRNYTAPAAGTPFTVNVNADFTPGTYTIILKNSGAIVWGGGSWAGASNANINLPTTGGAGTYGIANMIYGYKNFTVFPGCSNRIQVDRKCLNIFPGDGTYCTNNDIPLSYTFEGTATAQTWTITPGSVGVDWNYTVGNSSSVAPTIRFLTANTYTVSLAVTDVSTVVYNKSMTFTVIPGKIPAGTASCTSPNVTLTATGTIPADYPNYTWYDAASGGNVLGIGSPVTLSYGASPTYAPTSVWVEVSATATATSSGTNQSIGMASGSLTWPGRAAGNYGPTGFTVFSDVLTLKSFVVTPQFSTSGNFSVEIRNASNVVVFLKNYTTGASGTPYTVNINHSFTPGVYDIRVLSASIVWGGGSWAGASNAQISLPTSGGAGTYGLANMIYDYYNYDVTITCPSRVQVNLTCLLPISLISFNGYKNGNTNLLEWVTASEISNDYFDIQRSIDGINFISIGSVKGNGSTNNLNSYNFIDANPANGINYYKLVQHDLDGTTSSSQIISILNDNGKDIFTISPNPSNTVFNISISSYSGGTFSIVDLLGKVIATRTIEAGAGNFEIGQDLSKGAYVLHFSSDIGSTSKLAIKE